MNGTVCLDVPDPRNNIGDGSLIAALLQSKIPRSSYDALRHALCEYLSEDQLRLVPSGHTLRRHQTTMVEETFGDVLDFTAFAVYDADTRTVQAWTPVSAVPRRYAMYAGTMHYYDIVHVVHSLSHKLRAYRRPAADGKIPILM